MNQDSSFNEEAERDFSIAVLIVCCILILIMTYFHYYQPTESSFAIDTGVCYLDGDSNVE